MNEKYLMFWVWKYLESHGIHDDIVNRAKSDKWQFSKEPQQGEISVAQALEESYKAYKK